MLLYHDIEKNLKVCTIRHKNNSGETSLVDLGFDDVIKARTRDMLLSNSHEELINMIMNSPKLRSPSMGYTTEHWFANLLPTLHAGFTNIYKPSDNGPDSKVDLFFDYNGRRYRAQVKSIYSNTLTHDLNTCTYKGSVGITNNSKEYIFEEGQVVFKTKCPPRLDYDILVASMYLVTGNEDDFIYMPSYYMGYPTAQSQVPAAYRHYFGGSAETFTWPLDTQSRWTTDLMSLLDHRIGLPL